MPRGELRDVRGALVFQEIDGQGNNPPPRLPELLRRAQRDQSERMEQAAARAGFGRQAYRDWLALEADLDSLCAEAMDALAGWHASEPGLLATAQAWAVELRGMAWLAAVDLRAIGEAPSPPPPLLEKWRRFLAIASGSQRAGEALGAIALHSRVFPGVTDTALAAWLAQPFARPASHYLTRRRQPEAAAVQAARDRLLDAYASAALAAGAQRAAVWALDAFAATRSQPRG